MDVSPGIRHRPKLSEAVVKDEELSGASTHQEPQPSTQAVVQSERFIMLENVPQVPQCLCEAFLTAVHL